MPQLRHTKVVVVDSLSLSFGTVNEVEECSGTRANG
jgi:hypothetical protein